MWSTVVSSFCMAVVLFLASTHSTLTTAVFCAAARSQIEFGIVYSCIEDKMYTARKGKGAFCNGVPIKVSGQEGEYR